MFPARVIHPHIASGRRILAVSDIHGNLPFFKGLLEKVQFSPDDVLVLVGDMLEKGQHSLALLRYIMELSKTHTIYPVCGNCDGLVLRFFEDDMLDSGFFVNYLPAHPESILRQMAAEMEFQDWTNLPAFRQALREHYPEIWQWLRELPTIIETDQVVFVHGGVPSLEHMEELDSWKCMKNDDFLGQGYSFSKYVIVGHWPVTLYNPAVPSAAPIVDHRRKIASIDGGCVLKADGQLNALILSDIEHPRFSWEAYDGLPTVIAQDPQQPSSDSLNVRWGRSQLEMLLPGEELSLCRHKETGRTISILNHYLRTGPNGLWCEDSTDYRLPVSTGDKLKLVYSTKNGFLCKKHGVTGWYFGRVRDTLDRN